jgi:hypothetical protein
MTQEKLKWYSGISQDQECLNENYVVLHADDNVCRILSYEDGMYVVSEYPSALMSSAQVTFSNKPKAMFRFNDNDYLDATRYVRARVEDKENISNIYKSFCECCDCHELKNFLDSLTYSSATHKDGKLYSLSLDRKTVNVLIGVVRDNVPITHVSLTVHVSGLKADIFNEHEICDLIHCKLNDYGDPPLRAEVVSFVQNYLEMLNLSLKNDGIGIPEVN